MKYDYMSFFSRLMGSTVAQLVRINIANQALGIQTGHALGINSSIDIKFLKL